MPIPANINPENYNGYNLLSIAGELPKRQALKSLEQKIRDWIAAGKPDGYEKFGIPDSDKWWQDNVGYASAPNNNQLADDVLREAQNSRIMVDTYESVFSAPKPDPRIEQAQKAQIESAKRFRESIPLYAKELMAKPEMAARDELAKSLVDADKAANRRGLLYGGTRAKARTESRQKVAQGLATERAKVNNDLSEVADNMSQQAVDTGFSKAGQQQEAYSSQQTLDREALERLIKNKDRMNEAYGAGLEAIGTIGGKIAAKSSGA